MKKMFLILVMSCALGSFAAAGQIVALSATDKEKVEANSTAATARSGDSDATVWNKNDDGTKSLIEIDFAGKKYALDFRSATAATDSGAKPAPAQ